MGGGGALQEAWSAHSLYFNISDTQELCFIEEIPDETPSLLTQLTKLSIHYKATIHYSLHLTCLIIISHLSRMTELPIVSKITCISKLYVSKNLTILQKYVSRKQLSLLSSAAKHKATHKTVK